MAVVSADNPQVFEITHPNTPNQNGSRGADTAHKTLPLATLFCSIRRPQTLQHEPLQSSLDHFPPPHPLGDRLWSWR